MTNAKVKYCTIVALFLSDNDASNIYKSNYTEVMENVRLQLHSL